MCCGGASWKREEVPDHSLWSTMECCLTRAEFDFIDVREFRDTGCFTRLRYAWLWVLVIKSVAVYVADVYTAILLLVNNTWSGAILEAAGGSKAVQVPFSIGKWIFFGCIIASFLLLGWEWLKARKIIRSRDISYAFTNVMSNNHYCLRWWKGGYNYFCFFSQINNSKKKKDEFAFFVFFTFKGWKRLLIADAPRQVINALTLYSFGKAFNFTTDIDKYIGGNIFRAGVLFTMIFTVVIWIGSFILLVIAAIFYVPLLCYIRGNLKEYCCHKVDKRIAELVKRRARKRLAQEAIRLRKEEAGDYGHLKGKDGSVQPIFTQKPTLPDVGFVDDDDYYSGKGSEVGSNYARAPYAYPPGGYASAHHARYQLTDGPAPQPPYYAPSEGGYEPSIRSTGDRPLMAHQGPGGGAESSYSLVDAGGHPMSKAPSYRSTSSGGDAGGPHWAHEPAPPLPSHAFGYGDAGDAGARNMAYEAMAPSTAGYAADPRAYDQRSEHGRPDSRTAYAPHHDPYRPDSRLSGRPDSAYDLHQYYSDQPQGPGVGDSDLWTPGQRWPTQGPTQGPRR